MKFTEYLNNEMLCEAVIDSLNEEVEIDSLNESLDLIEGQLNEFLGLGKLASKIKSGAEKLAGASDTADKKIEAAKTAVKNKVDATKTAINTKVDAAKSTIGKTVADIGDKATATKDAIVAKKEDLKTKFGSVLKKSKSVFSKFGEEAMASLKPSQKELAVELAPLFAKIKRGKAVGGEQALMVIAAVLAGLANADGGFPTKTEFDKKLTMLRSQPGLASFTFSAKYNGEVEEDETSKPMPKAETVEKPKTPKTKVEKAAASVVRNIKKA